jgi:hypothetical protein
MVGEGAAESKNMEFGAARHRSSTEEEAWQRRFADQVQGIL